MGTFNKEPPGGGELLLGADRGADCCFGPKPAETYWRQSSDLLSLTSSGVPSAVARSCVISVSLIFTEGQS